MKSWVFDKLCRYRYRMARSSYDAAVPRNYFLDGREFDTFVARYGHIEARPFQDYSPEGMVQRARERAELLISLAPVSDRRVLEIGAADGLVLKELLARGAREAVAVDVVDMLCKDARKAGVQLMLTSAEDMQGLASASFDLIYSWGSLEHIPDVRATMAECIRLLKPGGTVYLEAGPLYYSPWGYHYYATLKVPYIHLLFAEEVLHDYAKRKHGGSYRNFLPWTNGRPGSDYLALVRELPPDMMITGFRHGYDWFSTNMVCRYPEVFKAKRVGFDDFFIDTVQIVLKKRKGDETSS